jgi:hypothetical protein
MFSTLREAFARVRRGELEVEGLLPSERIEAACRQANYQDHGTVYTAVVTMHMFLAQVLRADRGCQSAVCALAAHRSAQRQPPCSADTGGYCKARQRIPEPVYADLLRQSADALERQAPAEWRWCQRAVRVVDGSTLLIPDTPENRGEYPLQRGLTPGCHFPVVRILVIFVLVTGAVLDAALRPYQGKGTGETGMLRDLAERFAAGDVLLGDRYFAGFWDLAWWQQRGLDVVTRLPASRRSDFRRGRRLGPNDHLVHWRRTARPDWLTAEQALELPAELTLREVRVRVTTPGFRTRVVIVVTTLLDAAAYSAEKLAELYRRRWQAELNLRSLKTHLGMEQLRTKQPATLRKEFAMHLLGYNAVRRVVLEAARNHGLEPRQISFTGALQTLREFLARLHPSHCRTRWLADLLTLVAQLEVGHRPNRVEPYAVKRRPKDYPPLNQPRHDYQPPTPTST